MSSPTRRSFIKTGFLGVGGAALLGQSAALRSAAASGVDEISIGVVGVGSRGQHMMRRFLRVPGVRVTALCDIWEPRFEEGRRITGEATPVYTDHRRMLEDAELDAVLVATPLGLHAEHMTAACDSGRHVYGEKAMGLTVGHCNRIRASARRNGKLFQVGHQYRYAPWYRKAVERIEAGEIGRVTHIYGYWHRNYNWRRPVPSPELERQINWRLYREHSGGLLAELGSHHIDVANWIFGALPERVVGTGGISFYDDGRETFDNVQALYTYPDERRLFFSSIIGNHRMGFQLQVFGTGGGVELTLQDGTFFYEPMRGNSAVPEDMLEDGIRTSASLSTSDDMPYRGDGEPIVLDETDTADADLAAAQAFIASLRADERPFGDEDVGWSSAVAVALGNEAIATGHPVDFAPHLGSASAGGN